MCYVTRRITYLIVYPISTRRDQLQCALVCKKWNVAALLNWYKDLHLQGDQVYHVKKLLKKEPNERENYFKYGANVQKLTLNNDSFGHISQDLKELHALQDIDCVFDQQELILLLEYFPNIQNLDIASSEYSGKYLEYILDTESNGCLNQIKIITPPPKFIGSQLLGHFKNLYFSICYKYRATLTDISLTMNGQLQGETILPLLSNFTSLTQLNLKSIVFGQYTTIDLQRMCPHLTTLEYTTGIRIPDDTVITQLGDPTSLNSNLKSLKLYVPSLPVNYSNYLANHLFKQLDTFHLTLGISLFEWINEIGMENFLKFASRLGAVKDVSFYCRPNRQYSSKFTITLFEFIYEFMQERIMYCSVHFKCLDFPIGHSIKYNVKDGLSIGIGVENTYNGENQDDPNSIIRFPDFSFATFGPEIKCLKFSMKMPDDKLIFSCLKYALIHCSELEYFEFGSDEEYGQRVTISTSVMNQSKTDKIINSGKHTSQKDLKVITTTDFFPSSEWVTFFSTHLPNIKILVCDTVDTETDPPEIIDLTEFKKLETFSFMIELMYGIAQDYAFNIHLIYSDGDESYYCLDQNSLLTLNPISLESVVSQGLDTRSMDIKCNKDLQIVVRNANGIIIAEFQNGNLLDHSITL